MKTIITQISELQYDEKEYILYIKIKNDVSVDLQSIKENIDFAIFSSYFNSLTNYFGHL